MTSRTMVSPSSKTEWIISRSSCSMSRLCSARSTRSRSSASEVNGPSRKPRPGVSALPSSDEQPGERPQEDARASGPAARPRGRTTPRAADPACAARHRRASRTRRPSRATVTSAGRPSVGAPRRGSVSVTRTTAAVSQKARTSSSALTASARVGDDARRARCAPRRPLAASSSTRDLARHRRQRGRPRRRGRRRARRARPRATSRTTSADVMTRLPGLGLAPGGEQLALQAEHLSRSSGSAWS